MQCKICQQVARALNPTFGYRVPKFYDVNDNRFVRLSSWKELRENLDCPTCSRIAALFRTDLPQYGCDSIFEEYEYYLWDSSLFQSLRLRSESQSFWPNISIRPLAEGTFEHAGVVMARDWVDLERALSWVRSCDTTHDKCHRPFVSLDEPFVGRGMYSISVSRNCLVEAKVGEKYVTLSYVWGTTSGGLKCTKANLNSLRSDGSLSRKNIRQHLPDTIQRAMKFTLQLGFDLLWVDCFCIVQDDPVHTAAQINNMASIYSNSCLTLCTADGPDANSGLRGVPGCSQPRNIQQDILVFTDGLATSSWIRQIHGRSVYDERGWTFQEKILSRRVIAFTDHGLEWRCQETVAQEQHHHIRRVASTYSDLSIARRDTFWPCLKKWDNLVTSYLRHKLTYEEDICRAFSGISSALAGSMSEGFLFGLPQQFFDAALLWVPTEHLRPRKDTRNGVASYEFPSWSWVGWIGAIETQINAFGLGHERSNLVSDHKARQRDIFPQATWYKIKREMGQGTLVKIPNDYAKYQSEGLQGTVALPLGWSSHRDEDEGLFYYRYDKAPSSQTFWYPIPTVRSTQPVSEVRWSSTLFFMSSRSYLRMGSTLSREVQDGKTYPLYSLETEEGEWAGVVYVHCDPGNTKEQKVSCELVLMSGGFAFENGEEQRDWIPEWDSEERPRSGDAYCFYHCLWIERRGDISYRRGLARVPQVVWDTLSKDDVSIFLA